MRRESILMIAIMASILVLGMWLYSRAQNMEIDPKGFSDMYEMLSRIEKKTDAILHDTAKINDELTKKIQQLVSTQETILKELEIVKVRATRK
jgi:hypothetical protein